MKKTVFICTLPEEVQKSIIADVGNYHFCNGNTLTDEEKEIVLNSRLCDLEEVIDVSKYE